MTGRETGRQCITSKPGLLDLPEGVLITILKHLELETKCHLQGVCQTFRAILGNPSRGSFVWQGINVNDEVFRWARLPVLAGQAPPPVQTTMNTTPRCLPSADVRQGVLPSGMDL